MTDDTVQVPRQAATEPKARRRKPPKVRGVFEVQKGSDIWWVRYRDCAGQLHREKAGTRGMALALLDKRRTERRQGIKLPETIRRRGATVRELLDLAAAHVRAHYSTQRISASTGERCTDSRYPALVAEFGQCEAASLTPQRIEAGLAKLAEEREWAPATHNRYRDFLSLAFKLGLRNGKVKANPARLVPRRREDNGRVRFLSPEEEGRLRAVIQADCPEHEPELDLALYTGLRWGNQSKMRWADVDLERRLIVVGRAKNGHPFYAPINSAALAALARLKAMAGDSAYVILNRNKAGRGVGQPPDSAESWFNRAVAKAGLNDVCWHILRHTFASRAVMAGLDLRTVADLLGHRTLAMVMRYAHLAPQHRLEASERVAQAFPPVQSSTRSSTGDFGANGDAAQSEQQQLIIQ